MIITRRDHSEGNQRTVFGRRMIIFILLLSDAARSRTMRHEQDYTTDKIFGCQSNCLMFEISRSV